MSDEERLARQFHEVYERLAPSFGYATREETREFDPLSPNGLLIVAVCKELRDSEIERLQADLETAMEAARRCYSEGRFGGTISEAAFLEKWPWLKEEE